MAADPRHAAAWGALAGALVSLADGKGDQMLPALTPRIDVAVARALALDPENPDALRARIMIMPWYRNWAHMERDAKAVLRRRPDLNPVRTKLAMGVFANVGRFADALTLMRQAVAREPLVPIHQAHLAWLLWQVGDVAAARRIFAQAASTWPNNGAIWIYRVMTTSLGGRPDEGAELAQSGARRAAAAGPLPPDLAAVCAHALAGSAAEPRRTAVEAIHASRRAGDVASFIAIPYFAALGAIDAAFETAYDYLLGRRDAVTGERQPVSNGSDRWTEYLFIPATAAMRSDRRFGRLTAAIGLDDYWRVTGTRPDDRAA